MADQRFFSRNGPISLADIAALCGARCNDDAQSDKMIHDVSPLDQADESCISFLDNPHYLAAFLKSRAGACIVHPRYAENAPNGMCLLLSETPYRSYALAAQAFYPEAYREPGVAATACIDETAEIGDDGAIAEGVVIEAGVRIGDRCSVGANTVIGRQIEIGNDVTIGASATLTHCVVGDRVHIYTGVRIGQDGFGFAPQPSGHVKVPQLGRVLIGNDIEIGANTTIDRGSGPDTVIGDGCWIDNLVQIAHNVRLGRGCIIAAQAGIAGSAELGDFVVVGGQVAIAGHLRIGDGAQLAGKTGVVKNVAAGAIVGGTPAVPIRQWHRQTHILGQLARQGSRADG